MKILKYRLIKYITILFIISLNSCSSDDDSTTVHFAPDSSNTWTFMIYIGADNSLDGYDDIDVEEMISGLSSSANSYVNVILLQDKSGSDDSAMYRITSEGKERLDDGGTGTGHTTALGEINTGDPIVLSDFIYYSITNFPAERYMLVLWNHGNGTRKKSYSADSYTSVTKSICQDETSDDILYMDEVSQALSDHFDETSAVDLSGMDACLMGIVEVAYEMKNLAGYMCASMAEEWGYGWDYEAIFSTMTADGEYDSSAETLAELTVSSYRTSTSGYPDQTMSAVDLSGMDSLKSAIDSFAAALSDEEEQTSIESTRDSSDHFYTASEAVSFPYTDLGDFASGIASDGAYSSSLRNSASAVVSALSDSVISAYAGSSYGGYYGSGAEVQRGLSIFFTADEDDYQYQWWYTSLDTASTYGASYLYGNLDFCTADSDGTVENWKELMEYWYDSDNSNNDDTW